MRFYLGICEALGKRRYRAPGPIFGLLLAAVIGFAGSQGRAAGENPVIVVFGDSLGAGYNLGPGEGFAPQLERLLQKRGAEVEVFNASVSGDTTSAGRSRLDWAISGTPELVILELGANDALRGIDPRITRDNLIAMIESLQSRGLPILLAGMLAPPNMGSEYEAAFNGIYPELADKYDLPFYPFFLDGVALRQDLLQADGMHPTINGVAVMVEAIAPLVIRTLGLDQTSSD